MRKFVLSLLCALSFCSRASASASAWIEQAKLATGDRGAKSVFIAGDYAIVGAPEDDDSGSSSGSAYVFVRAGTTWTQQQKLTASDGAPNDLFGDSVSISGNYAIVGAPGKCAAYIFVWSGSVWSEQQHLTGSGTTFIFGASVAIDSEYAVVGDPYATSPLPGGGLSNAGGAFVFKRTTLVWSETSKLYPADLVTGHKFGASVSIRGDYIAVGGPQNHGASFLNGTAYIFMRSGSSWLEQEALTASDAGTFDEFGYSISISGNSAIVGARSASASSGLQTGAAYVYTRSGTSWVEQQKLTASNGAADQSFGTSVAISGDNIIIGANQQYRNLSSSPCCAY
jgi:hypothetical protein